MQIEVFIQLKHFLSERCGLPFCIFPAIPLSALLYPAFQGRDLWFHCNLRQGHTTDQEPGRLLQHFREVCRLKWRRRWQAGQKDILFHLEQGFEFHFSSIQFIYKPFFVFGKESVCSCSI